MAVNPLYPEAPSYDNYHLPAFPSLLVKGVEKHMEDVLNFDSRETDVILTTFPKSGTNWVIDILHMLTTGKPDYYKVTDFSTILEAADFEKLDAMKERRLLISHIPFRHLPKKHIENGYKIIYVMRNPKDVTVSYFNHMKKTIFMSNENFPGTWGTFLENIMSKKIDQYGNWFDHAKEWEKAKATGACKSVHTVTFEDMKNDLIGEIKKMSVYLGQKHSDEFLHEVAKKCTFESVVEATKTSAKDITLLKNMTVDGSDLIRRKDEFHDLTGKKLGEVVCVGKKIQDKMNYFIFSIGQVGNWKKWFTVEQNERFDELIEREMKDSNIKIVFQ